MGAVIMNAKLFFENSDYNYLKLFGKNEMIKFAEMYNESRKAEILENFIEWINSQPKETFKVGKKTLIKHYLKTNL